MDLIKKMTAALLAAAMLAFLPAVFGNSADALEAEDGSAPFTVIQISDTQGLIWYEYNKGVFPATTQWISDHAEELNLKMVIHTGDIMEYGFHQWEIDDAESALANLPENVPFLAVAGNHDLGVKLGSYLVWPERSFVKRLPEEEKYGDGRGVCGTFSAGGTDFTVVGLGWKNLDENAAEWARGIFNGNPDTVGIFFTHSFLNGKGELLEDGKYFLEHVVSKCPNIRLVLCGHSRDTAHRTFSFDDDGDGTEERTVNAVMTNFQSHYAAKGYLRVLTFEPESRSVAFDTYSPFLDDHIFNEAHPDLEQFTLENAF